MNRAVFYLRTAWHNLLRGGQRSLVALICIIFGVMSLVAMTLLSRAIENSLLLEPQEFIGADISMERAQEETIAPEQAGMLADLKAQGAIQNYSLMAYSSSLVFHLAGSSELHFPSAGMGVDASVYPLAGHLRVGEPAGAGLPALLQGVGDVVVTRDLADKYGLALGDQLVLSDLSYGPAVTSTLRGILDDTPNHQGGKVYYTVGTAEKLAASSDVLNTALLTTSNVAAVTPTLEAAGWRVYPADQLAQVEKGAQEMFSFFLNGAGILGLLVGGIGIANTMQVLLRRRRKEIAIWKTLGYQSGDLYVLFGLEAALLGALGSLAGAGLGVILSRGLVSLFSRTSTVLVAWALTPGPVVQGFLVGLVTCLIFSLFAIVLASRVRPAELFRNEPVNASKMPFPQALGLIVLLAIPLWIETGLIMQSLWKGAIILLVALAGLVILGGGLSLVLKLVTRLLPMPGLPLWKMARNSLRRRGGPLVFAMIALFVGVVALSLGMLVTQSASRVMEGVAASDRSTNLAVIGSPEQEAQIVQAVQAVNTNSVSTGYQRVVRSITT